MLSALLLDRWLGEPVRLHPLVGFGHLANWLEKRLNARNLSSFNSKLMGVVALLCAVVPIVGIAFYLAHCVKLPNYLNYPLECLMLYLAIGQRSLYEHTMPIARALAKNDLPTARKQVSYIVSRDTQQLTPKDIARASVESILENGHDGVIASLFYYLVGGVPLVVLHRLINTLDAMWGYKNSRFINFGWAAARFDDVMGWPSGKVTALLYILHKRPIGAQWAAWHLSRHQASHYKSLNGGMVMAAGANTLGLCLGGENATYDGRTVHAPLLGEGREVCPSDIMASLALLKRTSRQFCLITMAIGGLVFLVSML
ncbi:adenosylcobinamide-phosphate synthase CbiB [Alteromonas sp. C1M14]|uniref:adenosylcobinamide-phosphate synthase CbiB n=1 Tax=Alteromonas sp. C1M14 TaxID=2841567 RepID=UPI001C0A3798|nr:adenosylcobinamide-phosphate synthase CbiB [Alteromonas sp. C1M14]MBU2979625.1 adenosylcobinamide-phosphate synthase CbiB [Alteromonas sp. C1M14]